MAAVRLVALFAIVMSLFGFERAAHAMASGWAINDQGKLRLVSSVDGVGDHGSITLGLQFQMQPGWKIYWRSPGDAGYPPRVDWSGSKNVASASVEWPMPKRFSILGMESLGYKNEVVLPVRVKLDQPGEPVTVKSDISYLTCAEICVPQQVKLALNLPAGPADPSHQANLLARYTDQVPGTGKRHGLSIEGASISPRGEELVLNIDARSTQPFVAPDVFVEGPIEAFFLRPEVALDEDGSRARISVAGGGVSAETLAAKPLRVTLVDGNRAMEQTIHAALRPADAPLMPAPAKFVESSLLYIIGLALLGGLILNLMPCVLPVLSIKLLNVVSHGGADRREVRAGFVAAAAGILFSFFVLAGFLIGLKSAGMSIGWGIQFQQPVFLVLLTAVLVLFACNLFGLFEIQLPGRLNSFAARHGQGSSLTGHFLTGVFATLLATPCSAPFLGSAVGFALSRGAWEIFAVFTALGLGLAIPYLAVAVFPGVATRLPKPGPWMILLRKILAIALAATALWLLTIVYTLMGMPVTIAVVALLLAIPAVFAARRISGSRVGRLSGLLAACLIVAATLVPVVQNPAPAAKESYSLDSAWRAFDEAEVARLVKDGKIVLVDVTADWCITCQVNKKLVLETGEVAPLINGPSVVAMRADWTRPNPVISKYLARFGRYGIPFNVVYGPQAPAGIVLPELLTKNAVLSAFASAGGDKAIVAR